jgi:hypothetical protein
MSFVPDFWHYWGIWPLETVHYVSEVLFDVKTIFFEKLFKSVFGFQGFADMQRHLVPQKDMLCHMIRKDADSSVFLGFDFLSFGMCWSSNTHCLGFRLPWVRWWVTLAFAVAPVAALPCHVCIASWQEGHGGLAQEDDLMFFGCRIHLSSLLRSPANNIGTLAMSAWLSRWCQ